MGLPKRLLCISNGHGEDVIAVKILKALQDIEDEISIMALPIVGEGHIYQKLNINICGPTQTMPSGGFIYMEGKQLLQDLQGGLLRLTWSQIQAVRQWAKEGTPHDSLILAVGDIVPLIFGWWSGLPYSFVGTAKSDYYLRDEQGPHPRSGFGAQLESRADSVYLPWERWLMKRSNCRCVFPRDTITTERLQKWKIPAFDMGNPMMDGFSIPSHPVKGEETPLQVLLLPGSRAPEAYANWQIMLQAVNHISPSDIGRPITFLAALTPSLDLDTLKKPLQESGWVQVTRPNTDATELTFTRQQLQIQLSQSAFMTYSQQAQVAIAMAGTATEQFVGLGKPAITLPGPGPQFNPAFAEAQTRLLGESILLVESPAAVGSVLKALIQDPQRLQRIYHNGRRRMGDSGAGARIAEVLRQSLSPTYTRKG